MAEHRTMGRKKSDPPDSLPRQHAVVVKGTPEWKAWVERGSEHCRGTVSVIVDQALVRYFKEMGFDEPPPPR
jgi:hypothetical protein